MYANISIKQANDSTLKVSFPFASKDNRFFFTNFILPFHTLQDASLQQYTQDFATYPVTNACGKLEKTSDQTSLIFNLGNCVDSFLGYYQLKRLNLKLTQTKFLSDSLFDYIHLLD